MRTTRDVETGCTFTLFLLMIDPEHVGLFKDERDTNYEMMQLQQRDPSAWLNIGWGGWGVS